MISNTTKYRNTLPSLASVPDTLRQQATRGWGTRCGKRASKKVQAKNPWHHLLNYLTPEIVTTTNEIKDTNE
jgi:hypothetical protein